MKIEKLSINGNTNSLEVNDKIFVEKINKKLISEILYKNIANYKGTGNARHASRKAPIFVGGGVAHGPKGENSYKIRKLNKKEKKLGLKSLISEKNINKNLLVFEDFTKQIKKTKEMFTILKKYEATNSIIILDKNSVDKIGRSLKNIPNIKISDAGNLSLYDLLKYKKVIFTESSIKEIEKRYL